MFKRHLALAAALAVFSIVPLFAQASQNYDTKIEAISSINWITKEFVTNISLDARD